MLHTTHLVFKLPNFHEPYAPTEFKKLFKEAVKELNKKIKQKETFKEEWRVELKVSSKKVRDFVRFCNEVAEYNYPRHSLVFFRQSVGRDLETVTVTLKNKLENF